MKLMWLDYLVYSFGNCVMKLCIETGLSFPRMMYAINKIRGAKDINEKKWVVWGRTLQRSESLPLVCIL